MHISYSEMPGKRSEYSILRGDFQMNKLCMNIKNANSSTNVIIKGIHSITMEKNSITELVYREKLHRKNFYRPKFVAEM